MKILAVDDDPIILELLSQYIEVIGTHELITTGNGQDALALVQSGSHPDIECFLCDLQMPQMDGIELTRHLREIPEHVDTPVLMLTAMSDKRYIDAAFAVGAIDYVTKPFEMTEFSTRLRLVENLLEIRKTHLANTSSAHVVDAQRKPKAATTSLELYDPISIYDVDNVIEYTAMENYVRQLTHDSMFGCTTFAFTLRRVEEHHAHMSTPEFLFLISDVAEVISDAMGDQQFLMTYAGGGTFMCVTESGWHPNMTALMDEVNLSLSRTELFDNSGQPLFVRVSAGEAIRMIWKTDDSALEAVSTAYLSAEDASAAHERAMNDLWPVAQHA